MRGTFTLRLLQVVVILFTAVAQSPVASARPQQDAAPAPRIVRLDPRLDALVPQHATLDKIVGSIAWAEGPVWNRSGNYLLFSDVPNNAILRWKAGEGLSVFLKPSGYTGAEPFEGREPRSNGLAFDQQGRLVFCRHGDRRISRIENSASTW